MAELITIDGKSSYIDTPFRQLIIGVTTAPRQPSTLNKCIKSIAANGWRPYVFAEPDTDVSGITNIAEIVQRPVQYGAWHNWLSMCKELLALFPKADAFMTVQDDVYFTKGISDFIAKDLWPSTNVGFVSLYTPKHYQQECYVVIKGGKSVFRSISLDKAQNALKRERGDEIETIYRPTGCHKITTNSLWGACALIFPRDILEKVINHDIAKKWKGVSKKKKAKNQIANVDTAIGKIMNSMKKEMWFYNPSLTQHFATHSTLGHGGCTGRRAALHFLNTEVTTDSFQDKKFRFRYDNKGKIRKFADKDYDRCFRVWESKKRKMTMCFSHDCWTTIKDIVKDIVNPVTIEFGCGLSTLLFETITNNHLAIESEKKYYLECLETLKNKNAVKKTDHMFSGITFDSNGYDLVFIDGPGPVNSESRSMFIDVAGDIIRSKTVIVIDDTNRKTEQQLVDSLCNMFVLDRTDYLEGERMFTVLRA